MAEKRQKKPRVPRRLPCGCQGMLGTQEGSPDVFVLNDSSRVCRHGRRWRLVWKEMKPKRKKR